MNLADEAQITLPKPDDWHLHLRDGKALQRTVADSARRFGRAVIMPNLAEPVTTVERARAYRDRILAALPLELTFEPRMMLYLTESTPISEIELAATNRDWIHGIKLYPAGATTHSDAGVASVKRAAPLFAAIERLGLPLLIHGEVTDSDVDIFDRERIFVERELTWLADNFPGLKMVLEHLSCREAVEFIDSARDGIGGSITLHHLRLTRNDLFRGGINPHHYCLPIVKSANDRDAVRRAACGKVAHPERFFAGSDSAPHPQSRKECGGGAGGIYTAHAAVEHYAETLEDLGALERLQPLLCENGARFYGLPLASERITLQRQSWQIPASLPLGSEMVIPFAAGQKCRWQLI